MKKLSKVLLYISVLMFFFACKKEAIEDIKAVFNNTEWIGMAKYPDKPLPEPFSIEFYGNGTFTWHELSGDHNGSYTIDNNKREITLDFPLMGLQFIAEVTQENSLTGITHILSCSLNNSSRINLENSKWIGTYTTGVNLQLDFKPGQTVELQVPPTRITTVYTRAGNACRYSYSTVQYFSVIQSDNRSMKGILRSGSSYNGFETVKQ